MNHVQAVTVLEASHHDNNLIDRKSVVVKRHVLKDSNNNVLQNNTKESLNAAASKPLESDLVDEPEEYTLLGLVTFKSPIKWLNTISIILIHLICVLGFFTYPLNANLITTIWGE